MSWRIESLGRRTDLAFSRFAGEVQDHGDFLVLRTPSNPTYHWGNYLLFRSAPRSGDYQRWTALFEREFTPGGASANHGPAQSSSPA